jgi:hypothetical protein
MPCIETVMRGQKEYDFFTQMTMDTSRLSCCGPITTLAFAGPALEHLLLALQQIGMDEGYLDEFNAEVVDSEFVSAQMCAKHWILHSRTIGVLSLATESDDQAQIAYYIFMLVCVANAWDNKEISNYLKTVVQMEKKE